MKKRQINTRDIYITVRVNEKEKDQLKQIAEKNKKKIAEVLRDGGLAGKEQNRTKDKKRIAMYVENTIHLNNIKKILDARDDIPDELRQEFTELVKGEKKLWQY